MYTNKTHLNYLYCLVNYLKSIKRLMNAYLLRKNEDFWGLKGLISVTLLFPKISFYVKGKSKITTKTNKH